MTNYNIRELSLVSVFRVRFPMTEAIPERRNMELFDPHRHQQYRLEQLPEKLLFPYRYAG